MPFKPPAILHLSIHDLTRRSTRIILTPYPTYATFNSRPHKEVDVCQQRLSERIRNFQFTTSQGGRPYVSPSVAFVITFQFTTSQGGRPEHHSEQRNLQPFNSRPHKEVDRVLIPSCEQPRSFNSRPHKEVDYDRRKSNPSQFGFQFTTSQGGRPEEIMYTSQEHPFNSRPHKEVDV